MANGWLVVPSDFCRIGIFPDRGPRHCGNKAGIGAWFPHIFSSPRKAQVKGAGSVSRRPKTDRGTLSPPRRGSHLRVSSSPGGRHQVGQCGGRRGGDEANICEISLFLRALAVLDVPAPQVGRAGRWAEGDQVCDAMAVVSGGGIGHRL